MTLILTAEALGTHARVDDVATEEALLEAYSSAAQTHVEKLTGHWLTERGAVAMADDWGPWRLAAYPLALTEIRYTDTAGAEQVLPLSAVRLFDWHGQTLIDIAPGQAWPERQAGSGIRLALSVGYADGACPTPLVHAVRLLAADWYRNREQSTPGAVTGQLETGVNLLVANYRLAMLA